MLINLDFTIKDLSGNEFVPPAETIGQIIVAALLHNYGDESVSGLEKFHRGQLAQKVNSGGDIDLTVEELTKIKDMVGKFGTPLSVLQIFNHIEKSE